MFLTFAGYEFSVRISEVITHLFKKKTTRILFDLQRKEGRAGNTWSSSMWSLPYDSILREWSVSDDNEVSKLITEKKSTRSTFRESLLTDVVRTIIDINAKNVRIKEISWWWTLNFQFVSDGGWYAEGSFSVWHRRIYAFSNVSETSAESILE